VGRSIVPLLALMAAPWAIILSPFFGMGGALMLLRAHGVHDSPWRGSALDFFTKR
jgi:hypothetical protein